MHEAPYTVIIILEAKPDKVAALQSALEAVVGPSRQEPTNLEYRLD